MPVDIGRHANRGMAQLGTDRLQALAVAEEEARERVAIIPRSELAA